MKLRAVQIKSVRSCREKEVGTDQTLRDKGIVQITYKINLICLFTLLIRISVIEDETAKSRIRDQS